MVLLVWWVCTWEESLTLGTLGLTFCQSLLVSPGNLDWKTGSLKAQSHDNCLSHKCVFSLTGGLHGGPVPHAQLYLAARASI